MLIFVTVLGIFLNTVGGNIVIRYTGNFNIGALLSIRKSLEPDHLLQRCGEIEEVEGIQKLEAALLALEMINNDPKILPGVTLGIEVCDTCWSANIALHQSLFLIGGATIQGISDNFGKVNRHHGGNILEINAISNKSSVIGVIGPSSSVQTKQIQNLFELFNIPQIGYFYKTSQPHDDSELSTVLQLFPSSTCQSQVVRDILKEFNWSYVATVHTSGDVYETIVTAFRNLAHPENNSSGICIAKDLKIQLNADSAEADDIIREIDEDKLINVVICFCERQGLRQLYEATKRLNLTNRFTFIASDDWSSLRGAIDGLEEQAWGTISVYADTPAIPTFSQYFTTLKPWNNTRNPWFAEFWENKFQCTLPKNGTIMNSDERNEKYGEFAFRKFCSGDESLADTYFEHRKTGYIMMAIWVMAHGLHNMITEICGPNYKTVCNEMYPVDTKAFLNHLSNLSFYYNNELVTINDKNSLQSFVVVNYQKNSRDEFDYVRIGNWTNGTLNLFKELQSRENKAVTSMCSAPCEVGFYKKFTRNNKNQACCWECQLCGDYEYVSWDKKRCIECPEGEMPNYNRTACCKVPIIGRDWSEPTTIMIVTFTVTGLIATILTLYIFVKYKDTPVVKASSREICYLILFSMILSHISVFINLAEPTLVSCALNGTLPGISLTIMFAGLFTKTNRIARILAQSKKKFPKQRRRLMSTSAQVAITFFCVAIEIAMCFATLAASPLEPVTSYPSRDRAIRSCSVSTMDAVPALFNVFLLGLCIIYAIKTRNVPGHFNEAKFMGFAMLLSSAIWTFFFTLYFGTPFKEHILCMCLTLNASSTLILLFFPKLYIIILKPEKNRRVLFLTNKNLRTHIGPSITGSSLECPMNSLEDNNFSPVSENNFRSRKSVAIQTSSKLLQNLLSSLNTDDDQSFSDDDDDDNDTEDDDDFSHEND